MYETQLRAEISQGDIFADVSVLYAKAAGNEITQSDLRQVTAVLITHDCEFDKPESKYVYVAEVVPLSGSDRFKETVREGRVIAAFYLTPNESVAEGYVDLRRISRVEKRLLQSGRAVRVASSDDATRLALQRQIAIFFGLDRGQQRGD